MQSGMEGMKLGWGWGLLFLLISFPYLLAQVIKKLLAIGFIGLCPRGDDLRYAQQLEFGLFTVECDHVRCQPEPLFKFSSSTKLSVVLIALPSPIEYVKRGCPNWFFFFFLTHHALEQLQKSCFSFSWNSFFPLSMVFHSFVSQPVHWPPWPWIHLSSVKMIIVSTHSGGFCFFFFFLFLRDGSQVAGFLRLFSSIWVSGNPEYQRKPPNWNRNFNLPFCLMLMSQPKRGHANYFIKSFILINFAPSLRITLTSMVSRFCKPKLSFFHSNLHDKKHIICLLTIHK